MYYYDENGKQIRVNDVIKVFHFTGARRKRHYMYKWVKQGDGDKLVFQHLCDPDAPTVPLEVVSIATIGGGYIWHGAEVVQSGGDI